MTLTAKAQVVGGSADGWGCMRIQRKWALHKSVYSLFIRELSLILI
jgi:hypothetical protein